MDPIPYGRQNITQKDIDAVVEVLSSDFLTQGPAVPAFEGALKEKTGAAYCSVTSNATAALHLACLALGVGPGDVVWTSPITFVASANCAIYCGADIDFVDIDSVTSNISVEALETKLKEAELSGRLPKVVIPVHMGGHSAEMKKIHELGQKYGFKIIEDASHAIGGSYCNKPVGCCEFSDISVFSFHPVKIITSGEGGCVLTNSLELDTRVKLLRSHGITRDEAQMHGEPEGGWYYQQLELGFNYRMTDIQAALGSSQLNRLDDFIEKRRRVVDHYQQCLGEVKQVELPFERPDCMSSFHLYVVKVENRGSVYSWMRENNILVNVHYIPVHMQPYYKRLGFCEGDYPNAEAYYRKALSLPIYPDLPLENQNRVIDALKKVFL